MTEHGPRIPPVGKRKRERLQPPAVYVDGRLEAGFTEEEVLEVLKQAGFRSILPAHVK